MFKCLDIFNEILALVDPIVQRPLAAVRPGHLVRVPSNADLPAGADGDCPAVPAHLIRHVTQRLVNGLENVYKINFKRRTI